MKNVIREHLIELQELEKLATKAEEKYDAFPDDAGAEHEIDME